VERRKEWNFQAVGRMWRVVVEDFREVMKLDNMVIKRRQFDRVEVVLLVRVFWTLEDSSVK